MHKHKHALRKNIKRKYMQILIEVICGIEFQVTLTLFIVVSKSSEIFATKVSPVW